MAKYNVRFNNSQVLALNNAASTMDGYANQLLSVDHYMSSKVSVLANRLRNEASILGFAMVNYEAAEKGVSLGSIPLPNLNDTTMPTRPSFNTGAVTGGASVVFNLSTVLGVTSQVVDLYSFINDATGMFDAINVGGFLTFVGGAFAVYDGFMLPHDSTGQRVVNAAISLGSYVVAAKVGAKVGGAIGSFIPIPVVGTLVGALAGAAIGAGAAYLTNWFLTSGTGQAITSFVGNAITGAANAIGNAAVTAANAVGNAVVGAANAVGGAVVTAANAVGNAVTSAANAVGNAAVTAAKAVGNTVKKVFSKW